MPFINEQWGGGLDRFAFVDNFGVEFFEYADSVVQLELNLLREPGGSCDNRPVLVCRQRTRFGRAGKFSNVDGTIRCRPTKGVHGCVGRVFPDDNFSVEANVTSKG